MSLVKKVEDIVRNIDTATKEKSDAIENAEKLADEYKDVKPQSFCIPMERFHGLPTFHNEKTLDIK
ncbi:MAG: hypothetical protein ACNYNY_03960 [Candidatus Oxydemutatoraceae bacterium WSBS_2016_MAG_OTU14]